MRMYIIASSVSAEHGSEPQVGWRWLEAFASTVPVTLVVDPFWRQYFEPALESARFAAQVEVQYVDMPLSRVLNPNRLVFLRHHWWLFRVRMHLRAILKTAPIAYVTLSTTYFFPVGLLGARWLWWGPVGGGFDVPEAVMPILPLWTQLKERLRDFASKCLNATYNLLKKTSSTEWFVTARTPRAADALRRLGMNVEAVIPEPIVLSVDPQVPQTERKTRKPQGIRFAFVGDPSRSNKNFPLALLLYKQAKAQNPHCSLHLFGGSCKTNEEQVIVHGSIPRAEFLRQLASCDVLLFVSYREGYSSTLREALALNLTVVMLPVGGNLAFAADPRVVTLDPRILRNDGQVADFVKSLMNREAQTAPTLDIKRDYSDLARISIERFLGRVRAATALQE
jgi:hypothetical protein